MVNNLDDEDVENKFNLTKKLNIILTGFDTNGKIKTYTNIREVLEEWVTWRLDLYEKRRLAVIAGCSVHIKLCREKIMFIKAVQSGELKLNMVTKIQLVSWLANKRVDNIDKLIQMPMYSMTSDEVTKLYKTAEEWEAKRDSYVKTTNRELWYHDLRVLKNKLV